jgi:hypothetical protein
MVVARSNQEFQMTQPTLDERVSALERTVAELLASRPNTGSDEKDWRSTIGMFDNDPVMKEIQDEGRKIREADRLAAQQDETGKT